MTTAIRLEEPMLVTEQLNEVSAARAAQDTKPIRDAVDRVRQALDRYERSAVERAQQRLTRVMLQAIGHQLTAMIPAEHETEDAARLREAFAALEPMLLPPPELPAAAAPLVIAVVEPEPPAPPPSATAVRSVPRPAPSPQTVAQAESLLAEVRDLAAGWRTCPKPRLHHQLQAVAAEMRHLLTVFPRDHELRWALEKLPTTLHLLCKEVEVTEYIHGISSGAVGDWLKIATIHRRAIAKFDRDADEPISVARDAAPKAKRTGFATLGDKLGDVLGPLAATATPEQVVNENAHRWPALRAMLQDRPVLLIGGIVKPDRLDTIRLRTGVSVDWLPIDRGANGDAESATRRIEAGNVAACIIAHKFIGHSDWDRLDRACKSSGTPYAHCGKAGTAAVEEAFDRLEKRLARGEAP
jgi:hypothetical protein